jgi:miniconductance mechanosensitive channel
MEVTTSWINDFLMEMGLPHEYMKWTAFGIYVLFLTLVAFIAYIISHKIVIVAVRRIVSHTSVKWDDVLFNNRLLTSACHLVPPIIVYMLMPWVLKDYEPIMMVAQKVLLIYIVVVSVRVANVFFSSIYLASHYSDSLKGHSLKGLTQMLKILSICVGLIIIVSLLIDKNPVYILSGLGASAAVLMLVFKDTIVGLVAGVQLSANDMLRPGDWIEAPKHGVNGIVEDVSLTTVKVRNWDMTIVTVPPYSLVSDSFQNWRGMHDRGGRRVKRAINIDLNTVRFMNDDELNAMKSEKWMENYASPSQPVVNLHLFRYYVEQYIANHPNVNHEMMSMVRQLQSTNYGVPIELYFFTITTQWVEYEGIQAEVFDHMFAVAPRFGLRVFQSPSGLDLKEIDREG